MDERTEQQWAAQNQSEAMQKLDTLTLRLEVQASSTRPYQDVYVEKSNLKDFLKELSIQYGVDYDEIYATIVCESNFNINAYNKADEWAGGSYGVGQFLPSTWKYFNKLRGTNKDYLNPYDQLEMMSWAFSKNLQSHWSCWKILYK